MPDWRLKLVLVYMDDIFLRIVKRTTRAIGQHHYGPCARHSVAWETVAWAWQPFAWFESRRQVTGTLLAMKEPTAEMIWQSRVILGHCLRWILVQMEMLVEKFSFYPTDRSKIAMDNAMICLHRDSRTLPGDNFRLTQISHMCTQPLQFFRCVNHELGIS